MDSITLLNLFWITNAILWLFLIIITLVMGNPGLLRRRGYPDNYIAFLKRDYVTRSLMMALIIPVLELAAYFLSTLIVDDPSSRIEIIALLFIALVIPFPVIDNILTSRKLKNVKKKTETPLVIDLNHKTLHLVYHPVAEILLTLFVLVYAINILKPFVLFYLHIVLPWIFYLAARSSRITVKSHIKDGYLWAFVFITLNFAVVLYYLVYCLLKCQEDLRVWETAAGILLLVLLAGRMFYYFSNFSEFSRRLTPER